MSLAKNHKQRYQRKRAAARARDKIKSRIKDLHCKAAKHLCESYDHVFLPKFETRHMVRRAERKLHTKTARMMLTFSHYGFRQRLLDKAKSLPWSPRAHREQGLHQQDVHLLREHPRQFAWEQKIQLSVLFVERRSRRQWRAKYLSS